MTDYVAGSKILTGAALYKEGACKEDLEEFIYKYGFFKTVKINEEFIRYASEEEGWINYLLDHSYIKEKEKEVFYKEGDVFKHLNWKSKWAIISISRDNNEIALVCITEGDKYFARNWVAETIKVRDYKHIVADEVKRWDLEGKRLIGEKASRFIEAY